jgi:hypothetical protein
MFTYGEYRPDIAPHATDTMVMVKNAYASANGYRPVKGPSEIAPALGGLFKGGGSFVASDNTPRLIAGDQTDLYSFALGVWASKSGSLTVNSFWQFAQFGDDVICVNGGAPVDYDLLTNTAGNLAGSPPTADLVAIVGDFVVLGRVDGDVNSVAWCDLGDAENWTTGQSGVQPRYQGGKIMGVLGGEYGLVLQRFAITRMTYTGDPTNPFQFDTISTNYGCAAERSVAQAGDMGFFWSDRGFVQIQAGQITPIGSEKVDQTFRNAHSLTDMRDMSACVDPERTLVLWVMPGRVYCYNWSLQRWTIWELSVAAAFASFSENVTLEQLDTLYGNLDAIPYSLDDPRFRGGDPRVTIVGFDGAFSVLKGNNLEATFTLPMLEPVPGRQARLNRARPVGDATTGITLELIHLNRLGDSGLITTYTELRANGDMPVRIAARYIQPTVKIAAGNFWSFQLGLDLPGIAAGGRQ